jgi:hypothetical protein
VERRSFVAAVRDRTGQRAVLPMLERHAARLEQLPAGATERDAGALFRALCAAQRLYALSAVTIGDGGNTMLRAARRHGVDATVEILHTPALQVVRDALLRLRAVLGQQAAVVVVLPSVSRLVTEGGMRCDMASTSLLEAIRWFGETEPDGFVLTGHDHEADGAHDVLADFYGALMIRVGAVTTPNVAVWPDLLAPHDTGGRECLVTTPGEITPELTPADVNARLAKAMRSDH